MNYIKSISMNDFNGAFTQMINFNSGLNILSGVNGTGKTTVLKRIKEQLTTDKVQKEGNVTKVLAYSPKRNSEKNSIAGALHAVKQQNKTGDQKFNEAMQKVINDNHFESYDSFADLYSYTFQEMCKKGGDQTEEMNKLTGECNEVLKTIFSDYELISVWNSANGSPDVKLKTKSGIPLDLSLISCGESELLSLIYNIYFNLEKTEVYLIDEPEVHLNWNLEKCLFAFLNKLANEKNKQFIVTTHSRIIFDPDFKNKTQFLSFLDQKIIIENTPSQETLNDIAGELVTIISTSAPIDKTFFVEDEFHKALISQLLEIYLKSAEIAIVNDASGMIKNLYKLLRSNPEFNDKWVNAYLMIDGDGDEEKYKEEPRFIHLKRFVAESYCFHIPIMAKTLRITEEQLQNELFDLIRNSDIGKKVNHQIIKKLIPKISKDEINLELMNFFDCSLLFKLLLEKLGKKRDDYLRDYIQNLHDTGLLEDVFDEKLLDAIKK